MMKDKSEDRKSYTEKIKSNSDKGSDSKSSKEISEKTRKSSLVKSATDKNGMLCPKSVRNQMKLKEISENKDDDKIMENKEEMYGLQKTPISQNSENKTIEIVLIKKDNNLSSDANKSSKGKLNFSNEMEKTPEEKTDSSSKHKKKKKHAKSKTQNDSDDCSKSNTKSKKSRKMKRKKQKNATPTETCSKIETNIDNHEIETLSVDTQTTKVPMSLLVSYSSDEEEALIKPNINNVVENSPNLKSEKLEPEDKSENKIELKIKPTKSPGKSAWDSTDSEPENELKEEKKVVVVKSRSAPIASKHTKHAESSVKEKSESKSCSKSYSESQSRSGTQSRSQSRSRSSKSHSRSSDSRSRSYNRSHSRSYSESSDSRSRSYTRSRSRTRKKSRHHRRHSSSYSRSHSPYRSRSISRSSSESRSSGSYCRSRSRYKSSYSNRYHSRSFSRSSRSRSRTSYYRSSYRRHKRSSTPEDFLDPQSRKAKQTINRSSLLLSSAPKPVDIGKKIAAIKESQKKVSEAFNNPSLSNLNIPLPPEKPKTNQVKPGPGEWCPSMDFGGPVAKKAKKSAGTKNNNDIKSTTGNSAMTGEIHSTDYNYIGPQVSSDLAKKLGLDVKANNNNNSNSTNSNNKKDKETIVKNASLEQSVANESYFSQALDANHLALQSRAYQHRLNNLQGNANSEFSGQPAQYFHPLYMSPSSLTNNLTATALAAVASEQLPASVAGSLAQAAVQRIMSSSNLTGTYNSPAVMATPTASYQSALHHTIPASCSTLVANTPSGLIPISLLQQGAIPYGINQLVLQHLQQQALGAQLGQAIAIPNQALLGGINPLLLQATNQQALLQSLGFGGAQTQLLASPLNTIQNTLLMAAQQQQQQILAAAQINQAATLQAAHLQAQLQAQARAASIQNLQQAAQMQSSAQNAVAAAVAAASIEMDHQLSEQQQNLKSSDTDPLRVSCGEEELKTTIVSAVGDVAVISENQNSVIIEPNNLITSSTTELNHYEDSAVNTTVTSEPLLEPFHADNDVDFNTNDISSSSVVKQQAPRIIYNSPAVMASIVTSPVTKP